MEEELDRFVQAQEHTYATALEEIRAGEKRSHWMWFIFPQLRGLGSSPTSYIYGINGIEEAREYLMHPVLSARLTEISEAMLEQGNGNAAAVLGPIDAMKLMSCMTLFAVLSEDGSVFHRVLKRFYGGRMDPRTLELLGLG